MSKLRSNRVLAALLVGGLSSFAGAAATQAEVIIQTNFVSTSSNQDLPGTTIGLTTNLPGGTWQHGAGFNFGIPEIRSSSAFTDRAYLVQDDTALAVSIGSAGSYVKPTVMTVAGGLILGGQGDRNDRVGLGFWSTVPAQINGSATSSLDNFTGLVIEEDADTIQLYEAGSAVGSAVALGVDLVDGVAYEIAYTVDTTTGALSGVTFNGNTVAGITSSAFTDAATENVGALTLTNSRGSLDELTVTVIPEPASVTLLAVGSLLLVRRR